MRVVDTHFALAKECVLLIVVDSAFQLSLLAELGLVISKARHDDVVSAYSAVLGVHTYFLGVFNFALVVTMSRTGKAVGREEWVKLGGLIRTSLTAALLVAMVSAAALWGLRDPLFRLMDLSETASTLGGKAYYIRLAAFPGYLLQRVATGVLSAYKRVLWLVALSVLNAAMEVGGVYLGLAMCRTDTHTDNGEAILVSSTIAATVVAWITAIIGLVLMSCGAPLEAQGQVRICGKRQTMRGPSSGHHAWRRVIKERRCTHNGDLTGTTELGTESKRAISPPSPMSPSSPQRSAREYDVCDESEGDNAVSYQNAVGGPPPVNSGGIDCHNDESRDSSGNGILEMIKSYLASSANMMVRSLLLQTSIFCMAILASRLKALPAHQVVLQLWMVTSYVCDGFADAGTIYGSMLLGQRHFTRLQTLCTRLVVYGFIAGVASGLLLLGLREDILRGMTTRGKAGEASRAVLRQLWPLLCVAQPVNALVFVYDGLVYAVEEYGFVRNVMLIGAVLLFLPVTLGGYFCVGTLLMLWVAKGLLNTWRCVSAMYIIEVKHRRRWKALSNTATTLPWYRCFMSQASSSDSTEHTSLVT